MMSLRLDGWYWFYWCQENFVFPCTKSVVLVSKQYFWAVTLQVTVGEFGIEDSLAITVDNLSPFAQEDADQTG